MMWHAAIVSMHLGHPGTVTAILHGLAKRRLRPVTLTELLATQRSLASGTPTQQPG